MRAPRALASLLLLGWGDGGGYHVTYAWEREGSGFVLVETHESSH